MKSNRIICPHCNYELTDDDMLRDAIDLFALPKEENNGEVECPSCKADFWVEGSYEPIYETFKEDPDGDN